MNKVLYILLISILFSSCNTYQKVLKSEETSAKFELATKLFEAEKWSKSLKLCDQILQKYRGKPQAEKLTYMHAMCSYKLKDYYIASYQFDKFTDIYPKSEKAEEASFLSAKGYYFGSPVYSKEQKETVEAIEKLQLFINAYPNSKYLNEANELVRELDFKLEKKAFEIAKQYNIISGFTGDLNAAIKSLDNFLLEFPGTSLREDAIYYKFDSAYKLATLSVDYLKEKRIEDAIEKYDFFKKSYSNSKYLKQATVMKEELEKELKTLTSKS